MNGDHPLVSAELIASLVDFHREAGAAATVVTVDRDDPESLGRVVRDPNGEFERIVETKHPEGIPPEVLAIHEVNTNTFAFEGERARRRPGADHERQRRRRVLHRRRAAARCASRAGASWFTRWTT